MLEKKLLKEKIKDLDESRLFDFIRSRHSIAEIIAHFPNFSLDDRSVKRILANPPLGRKVYKDNSLPGADRYLCVPHIPGADKNQRIWESVFEEDGGPAVDIIFPNNIGWDGEKEERMRIVPLADLWFGHRLCNQARFEELIAWIAETPHVFCFLNGDLIFPMPVSNDEGRNEWEMQSNRFLALIKPVAHKILWAQAGCFEDAMDVRCFDAIDQFCRKDDIKICARHPRDIYDIPYFRTPMHVGIHWGGNLFTFFCVHGKTQAQKKGSKINAALRAMSHTEHHDFYVMSHIRDNMVASPTRVREDVVGFQLKELSQRVFVSPGFVDYDGSRESKWNYPLPSRGQVDCCLFKDGRSFLYASSKTINIRVFEYDEEGGV